MCVTLQFLGEPNVAQATIKNKSLGFDGQFSNGTVIADVLIIIDWLHMGHAVYDALLW